MAPHLCQDFHSNQIYGSARVHMGSARKNNLAANVNQVSVETENGSAGEQPLKG